MSQRVEGPGLVEETLERPEDVVLPRFPMGQDLVLDVIVVNLLQQSTWPEAAHIAWVTIGEGQGKEERPIQGEAATQPSLQTLAFETFGI